MAEFFKQFLQINIPELLCISTPIARLCVRTMARVNNLRNQCDIFLQYANNFSFHPVRVISADYDIHFHICQSGYCLLCKLPCKYFRNIENENIEFVRSHYINLSLYQLHGHIIPAYIHHKSHAKEKQANL